MNIYTYILCIYLNTCGAYIYMIMIICINKKDTLQVMVTNKQQSPNFRMSVESYKKHIWLIINLKAIIILIYKYSLM